MKINNWEELENYFKEGDGIIYNDFGSHNGWNPEEYNKVHKANCLYIRMMTPGSVEWTYWFSSLEEAKLWLKNNRESDGFSYCKGCLRSEI